MEKGRENLSKAETWQKAARKKKVIKILVFWKSIFDLLILPGHSGDSCSGCSSNTPSRYFRNVNIINVKQKTSVFSHKISLIPVLAMQFS